MSNSIFQMLSQSSNDNMINNMMEGLKRSNPQAYDQLRAALASGNQDQIIANMIGQLNPQQVGQFRNMANMLGINVNKYIK